MDMPVQDFANIANDRTVVGYIDVERVAISNEREHYVNVWVTLKPSGGASVDFKWFNLELAKTV